MLLRTSESCTASSLTHAADLAWAIEVKYQLNSELRARVRLCVLEWLKSEGFRFALETSNGVSCI